MSRGIYRKYIVERTDGSSGPGGKHEHCRYFVLDLAHDPFALPALRAYAKACEKTHPILATDLRLILASSPGESKFLADSPNEMADTLMELKSTRGERQ